VGVGGVPRGAPLLDIEGPHWHTGPVRTLTAWAVVGLGLSLSGCKSRSLEARLEQAETLTREKPAAALEELDRLAAQGADRHEISKAKAAAHQRLGQLAEAERLLSSVLAESPNDREALEQLANVSVAEGKLDEARRHLTVAIRHKPPHVPTLLLFATLAQSREDGQAGLAAFDLLVGESYHSFRKSAEYAAARGALLLARGDGQQALDAWLKEHAQSRSFDPKLSLLMATSLAKLQKGGLALWLLARASSSPSATSEVHEALAERALSMGDVRLGELALSRMGGDLNRKPGVLLLEARLLELQDQGLEATKLTKRALDAVPAEREAQKTAYALTHARALAKEGLYDRAREVLDEVLKRDPEHGRTRIMLAAIEIEAGHAERVPALVEALSASSEYRTQAETLIVRALVAKKDKPGAKQAARRFFERDRESLHARLLLAQTLAELGEMQAGLELLDDAPPAQLAAAPLVRLRIQLTQRVRGPARAEALIREYLGRGTDLPELEQTLGEMLAQQKRLPEAEAVFRKLSRDDPSVLETVARLEREQGRLEAAIATVESLVATSPASSSAWLLLAVMRSELGNRPGAIAAYEEALRLDPNDPVALNNLALVLIEQDSTKPRAPALARRATTVLSDNPALLDTLGWVLIEAGEKKQIAEAVQILERCARALDTPEVAFHYGVALARAGRGGEAKRELEKALKGASNPTPPWRPRAERELAALR